ncbi:Ammonium transporter NrgA [Vibrio aerogenes CECT 7868]|uniref:Ammonium transporter n=1 Tax=Vibrio aerogenes CECT 7868 TaxID=1216006 RepID=A0A1M6BXQ6_9VIBR|nr:Ammonium transporter NrgA [Vibrio aerogenes CECT 7868]
MNTLTLEVGYALDTFYLLMSAVLVMWMAAGFAMLESGLVRTKNTVEILNKNILLYSVACIVYLIVGYNLMYPGDNTVNAVIPGISFFLGDDYPVAAITAGGENAPVYSGYADFFFQAVFAAATMSIVSGAVAERMRLWPFMMFAVVMVGFLYPVEGYWKWGGGFLDQLGYLDYAGSGVVHLAGAAAAFAAVLLVGPRTGRYGPKGQVNPIPGANLPLATLGMLILWMGWFGFNGGSELKISDVSSANHVARVFVNTNAAAAAGMVTATLFVRFLFKKTDLTMSINGALAGLVAITAEPLMPSAGLATLIGGVAGVLVVASVLALDKVKMDDPVGAISVHGTAGIWGILAVVMSHPDATLHGQIVGIAVIVGWMCGLSYITLKIIRMLTDLRVSPEEELEGMDIHECGMSAYPEFASSTELRRIGKIAAAGAEKAGSQAVYMNASKATEPSS